MKLIQLESELNLIMSKYLGSLSPLMWRCTARDEFKKMVDKYNLGKCCCTCAINNNKIICKFVDEKWKTTRIIIIYCRLRQKTKTRYVQFEEGVIKE